MSEDKSTKRGNVKVEKVTVEGSFFEAVLTQKNIKVGEDGRDLRLTVKGPLGSIAKMVYRTAKNAVDSDLREADATAPTVESDGEHKGWVVLEYDASTYGTGKKGTTQKLSRLQAELSEKEKAEQEQRQNAAAFIRSKIGRKATEGEVSHFLRTFEVPKK